jgi:hypothetical protein
MPDLNGLQLISGFYSPHLNEVLEMFYFIVQARVIPSKHAHCTFQVCIVSELATVD